MKNLIVLIALVMLSACSDDKSFVVESKHVSIVGEIEPTAKLSGEQAKTAFEMGIQKLEP